MQDYRSNDRWQNEGPITTEEYPSDLYGQHALASLEAHDPSRPLCLHLWQGQKIKCLFELTPAYGLSSCTFHGKLCMSPTKHQMAGQETQDTVMMRISTVECCGASISTWAS